MQAVCCPPDRKRHRAHEKDIEKISGSCCFGVKSPLGICEEGERHRNAKGCKVRCRLVSATREECPKHCPMNERINHPNRCISGKQLQHCMTLKIKVPDPRIPLAL